MQHAAAKLPRQLLRNEDALEHLPARAVLQHALVPAGGFFPLAQDGSHDDELARDASHLREEAKAVLVLEVAVEVAREDTFERSVGKGQGERVALDEIDMRRLRAGSLEHRRALIQADDLAAQMASEETRSTGDVK